MTIGVLSAYSNERDARSEGLIEGVILVGRAVVAHFHNVNWTESFPRCQYLLSALAQVPEEHTGETLTACLAWSDLKHDAGVIAGRTQWRRVRPGNGE